MVAKIREGTCKLTGKTGRFVRAHIIPESLTRPERKGAYLAQHGFGTPPLRRWSSWYDQQLVIAEGEEILRDYDTKAISELRKNGMVWSSWGERKELKAPDFMMFGGSPWGIRSIKCDTKLLRLFYLSVLWRAAATSLPEFSSVAMLSEDIDRLRTMVITGNSEPLGFFPISLTQLSTVGIPHNQAVFADLKAVGGQQQPIFRVYFDGLIAHIHYSEAYDRDLGPLGLGNEDTVTLSTITFEEASQRAMLVENLIHTSEAWPERTASLLDVPSLLARLGVKRQN